MVGCVQSVVGKKKFLVQLEDGQNNDISSSSLVYLSLKEEIDMEELISNLPEKEQGELLTINGDTEFGSPCIFGKCMYLSVFYCLCYVTDVSSDMSEDKVAEERDPDLNEEEDTRLDEIIEDHCNDFAEDGGDKNNIHAQIWEVYVKEYENLIKREFSVSFPHPKGGGQCFGIL